VAWSNDGRIGGVSPTVMPVGTHRPATRPSRSAGGIRWSGSRGSRDTKKGSNEIRWWLPGSVQATRDGRSVHIAVHRANGDQVVEWERLAQAGSAGPRPGWRESLKI
jgi:hypothetical protein